VVVETVEVEEVEIDTDIWGRMDSDDDCSFPKAKGCF
jgi:hypothetical protein